jgi:hypothetical protein
MSNLGPGWAESHHIKGGIPSKERDFRKGRNWKGKWQRETSKGNNKRLHHNFAL